MASNTRIQLRDRRRRRREESERAILDAAERLLRERPFRELTLEDVMAAAGQSRTAFYRHFDDREGLVIRLLSDVGAELLENSATWFAGSGDPRAEGRAAMTSLVGIWEQHGPLLRAISEAASYDEEVEHAYTDLVGIFIDATVARVERDLSSGRIEVDVPDVREMAVALCWMTERYLVVNFGKPGGVDRATAIEVLHTVWMRGMYRFEPIKPDAP
jgi:TetR/AcrR family transcriptional regulator, ethionamide resistance regulator